MITAILAHIVDGNDVGMHEFCGGPPLVTKPRHVIGIQGGQLGEQNLQRAGPLKLPMMGPVDPSHSSLSQQGVDPVDAEVRPHQRVGARAGLALRAAARSRASSISPPIIVSASGTGRGLRISYPQCGHSVIRSTG